jgi:hypothetical protein
MTDDGNRGLMRYAPIPIPPWVRERAAVLKQYLSERGVQRSPGRYGLDEACLLLAGELLIPEMPFTIVGSTRDEELVLVHCETDVGPKPAKSVKRLERAIGVARPDGILSCHFDLPWILTTFKGASIAAEMGYITIPIAELRRVVGSPPDQIAARRRRGTRLR